MDASSQNPCDSHPVFCSALCCTSLLFYPLLYLTSALMVCDVYLSVLRDSERAVASRCQSGGHSGWCDANVFAPGWRGVNHAESSAAGGSPHLPEFIRAPQMQLVVKLTRVFTLCGSRALLCGVARGTPVRQRVRGAGQVSASTQQRGKITGLGSLPVYLLPRASTYSYVRRHVV